MTTQHVIKSGESLSAIAHKAYGSISSFRDIADANDLDIFAGLPVGEIITLPDISEITLAAASVINGELDLSSVKQPEAESAFSLISWVL